MALRTNSKQAKENIKNYIIDCFHDSDFESWNNVKVEDYNTICEVILSTFYEEKMRFDNRFKAGRMTKTDLFFDWCQGLPSILGCEYYYDVNACDLLGSFLDETAAEKAKYTENEAEACITRLLWRELNAHGTINTDYDSMVENLKNKGV